MTSSAGIEQLETLIRTVPDFPEPGIVFRDVTPLLAEPGALQAAAELLAAPYENADVSHVVGIEARGFLFGPLVAGLLGAGFVPARKPGKLPRETVSVSYGLEYGSDVVEIHRDALGAHDRVLIVDDVLATGGTAAATTQLVEELGATPVSVAVLIELLALDGRARIRPLPVSSVVQYG